jgi:hypothetical protein
MVTVAVLFAPSAARMTSRFPEVVVTVIVVAVAAVDRLLAAWTTAKVARPGLEIAKRNPEANRILASILI